MRFSAMISGSQNLSNSFLLLQVTLFRRNCHVRITKNMEMIIWGYKGNSQMTHNVTITDWASVELLQSSQKSSVCYSAKHQTLTLLKKVNSFWSVSERKTNILISLYQVRDFKYLHTDRAGVVVQWLRARVWFQHPHV